MDTSSYSVHTLGMSYSVKRKTLQRNYRESLSRLKSWSQRSLAKDWLLYPENLGAQLSSDETSLSHGKLYTILTNNAAKGIKGAIVAIVAATKADIVIEVLQKIPEKLRRKVTEITLDIAGNMELITKCCFRSAVRMTERFHEGFSRVSFNAKKKAFRSRFRGVRSTEFFLYRLTQLYA